MAIKKRIIHCLLVFCIALQPALGAIAMDVEHSTSGHMHELDCDPVGSMKDVCADTDCRSITHSCSSQAGASYLPASSLIEDIPGAKTSDRILNDPEYRQNITDPIYRPPIT